VAALEANQYFVFASPNKHDSMALGLYPVDPNHTRLVWRIHLGTYNWASPWILAQLFTDLVDFVAIRQNLRGIRARAEGRRPRPERTVYAELLMWVACFVMFLAVEIVLLVRVQPPRWITVTRTLTSLALLCGPFERTRSLHPRN
jgi:hypothetical protein